MAVSDKLQSMEKEATKTCFIPAFTQWESHPGYVVSEIKPESP
jgi:hypothetical protein